MPQAALHVENGYGMHIGFHSPEAARTIVVDRGDQGFEPGVLAFAHVSPPSIGRALPQRDDGGWTARIGFSPAQVRTIVSIDANPLSAMVMQLTPDASQAAGTVLLDNGYASQQVDGQSLLMRGGEDFSLDLTARDPYDPFGGQLGRASRIGIIDDRLVYSTATPFLTLAMRGQGASLLDHPDIAGILTALDHEDVGHARLLQAIVLSDPFLFYTDQRARPSDPVPPVGPWTMGLLAEVSDGMTDTAIIALAFVDAASAAKAAETLPTTLTNYISATFSVPLFELLETTPMVRVSQVHPRVVLLEVSSPISDENQTLNRRHFYTMIRLIISGDASFLSPL